MDPEEKRNDTVLDELQQLRRVLPLGLPQEKSPDLFRSPLSKVHRQGTGVEKATVPVLHVDLLPAPMVIHIWDEAPTLPEVRKTQAR
jgi:hypothetical protein